MGEVGDYENQVAQEGDGRFTEIYVWGSKDQ